MNGFTCPTLNGRAGRRRALAVHLDDLVAGLDAGADDYLEAPYDPMRLITKVARLIERKRKVIAIYKEVGDRAEAGDADLPERPRDLFRARHAGEAERAEPFQFAQKRRLARVDAAARRFFGHADENF